MGFHQSGVEEQDHLPQPAGHDSCDAAQDTIASIFSLHLACLLRAYFLQILSDFCDRLCVCVG